jgi:hypothetical protein
MKNSDERTKVVTLPTSSTASGPSKSRLSQEDLTSLLGDADERERQKFEQVKRGLLMHLKHLNRWRLRRLQKDLAWAKKEAWKLGIESSKIGEYL